MQRKHPLVPQVLELRSMTFWGGLEVLTPRKKTSKLCAMIQWPGFFPWISRAYDGIIPEILLAVEDHSVPVWPHEVFGMGENKQRVLVL